MIPIVPQPMVMVHYRHTDLLLLTPVSRYVSSHRLQVYITSVNLVVFLYFILCYRNKRDFYRAFLTIQHLLCAITAYKKLRPHKT